MKKLIYSALATGAALAVAFGASADVKAAENETAEAKVTVVKSNELALEGDTLTIENESAKQILVGTATLKKNATAVTAPKTWDVYDNSTNSVKVDLSKIAKTKDAYLEIKTDFDTDDKALIVKVPASITVQAKYEKKTGDLEIIDKATAKTTKTKIAEPVYRTESGSTKQAVAGLDLASYQMTGGVIYVSAPQDAAEADSKADVTLPRRASKEVKVSIAKLANAPKVTANYVTGEITVPKGASYRSYLKTATTIPSTEAAIKDDKGKYVATKFKVGTDIVATDDFAVDVQTEAIAGTKLASKLGHYIFTKQTATEIADNTFGEYTETANKKGVYTAKVKNNSATDSYTFTWWDSTADDAKKYTKTVKPGATGTFAKIASVAGIAVERVGTKANAKNNIEAAWPGTMVKYVDGPKVDALAAGGSAAAQKYTFNFSGGTSLAVTVNSETITNGTELEAETEVTVTDTGYLLNRDNTALEGYTLKDASGNDVSITAVGTDGKAFKFTMPASNVTFAAAS